MLTEVFASFAAGDALRAFGLFAETFARQLGAEPGLTREAAEAFLTMGPQPEAEEQQSLTMAVTDVMTLADGRVGAFVVDRTEGMDMTVYVIVGQEGDQ